MFPRNAWYVASTPDELADRPLGRRVCGYRGLEMGCDGKTVAVVVDFITPETDTSTGYFWGMARRVLWRCIAAERYAAPPTAAPQATAA